jgi:hypothetical protein
MAAQDQQMSAKEPLGIQKPYDIGGNPWDAIYSRRDTEPGSSRDLCLKRFEPFLQLCFVCGKLPKLFFSFLGAGTDGALMAHPVYCPNEVLSASDFFPMESTSELLVLMAEFQEVLVKLNGIDCYSPLLGGKLFASQYCSSQISM